MFKALCTAGILAISLAVPAVPASAGGWSGGERDMIFWAFKRGYTLERTWNRLSSRR